MAQQLWRMHQEAGWRHICMRELFLMALVMAGTSEIFLFLGGDQVVSQIQSWQVELGLETEAGQGKREGDNRREAAASIIQRLDLALILGAHAPLVRPLVAIIEAEVASGLSAASEVVVSASPRQCKDWPVTRPLERLGSDWLPSVAQFEERYFKVDTPVILHGVMARDGWSGVAEWRRMAYWRSILGHRLLPVEVGCMVEQLDERAQERQAWREELLVGSEFIERFMEASTLRNEGNAEGDGCEVGYVAQHPLCEQVDALKKAFTVPPYCQLGRQEAKNVNVWMGTHGTVTALHYDSYDNILAQVVGRKYVRLYSPKESHRLYALQVANEDRRGIASQKNVSAVHVGRPEHVRFPLFAEAEYVDMVMGPDDMLFIPAGWWHYVESLTPSVSVNFWF